MDRNVLSKIPEKVRRTAAAMEEAGRRWLTALPLQVADLEQRWAIEVGLPTSRASEAFVAHARTSDGLDVILKVVIPGIDPARQELRILRAAKGIGYARLIRADETANAMLLEKLGPQLHDLDLTDQEQLRIICATLREAWSAPPPEGHPLLTGAQQATKLAHFMEQHWASLGKPCSERAMELALLYAERRRQAFDPWRSVVVHGDAHASNTLRAPGSPTGFRFVDPDGALAERAFDLAIPMREWGSVMPQGDRLRLGLQRCALLSELSGVPRQPIWEWALIQCVSNGLVARQRGLAGAASVQLAMADAWAAADRTDA